MSGVCECASMFQCAATGRVPHQALSLAACSHRMVAGRAAESMYEGRDLRCELSLSFALSLSYTARVS